jgi:hypothetical protein
MNSCSEKAWKEGFPALSKVEQTVHLVSWATLEIENGGISQLIWNSNGEYAPETVDAFEAVGAHDAAAALRVAIPLLRPGVVYETVSAEEWQLTRKCYAQKPDMWDCLCTYIEAHAEELKVHEDNPYVRK